MCFFPAVRIIFVILESECSSFVGAASTTANSAADEEAVGAFEVAGLPFLACVGVSRVHACPVKLDVGAVADYAKVALLKEISEERRSRIGFDLTRSCRLSSVVAVGWIML